MCVTGAAGQIGYALLYSIASGNVFGPEQVINILPTALCIYIYMSFFPPPSLSPPDVRVNSFGYNPDDGESKRSCHGATRLCTEPFER